MGSLRKRFTVEFKSEAVALAAALGNTAQAARDLGIPGNRLYAWQRKAGMAKADRVASNAGRKLRESEELRQLRKKVLHLEKERDFLKKAAAFFAQQEHDTRA